jgi:cleavage stimulation factor subunit 3
MTEPAVLNAVHDVEEFSTTDDQTQPTTEILNVLNQLNNKHNVKPEPLDSELPPAPPPTELEALTAELKQRPHDPDGWRRLVELAEQSGEIDKIRAAYDALLLQYPNTVCDPCPIRARGSSDIF